MSALVFVDTNVLLYARDAGEPARQPRAAQWLEHLWRERTGRTSIQVVSEYYANVTGKLDPGLAPDEAWDDVTALFAWAPLPIDEALLHRGREVGRRHRLSWRDSLIVGAAQLQDCQLLLSEEFQDGGIYGGVTVRSPFTLALSAAPSGYAPEVAAAGRHPRRGRPARAAASVP